MVRSLIIESSSICERNGSDKDFLDSKFSNINNAADLVVDDCILIDVKASAFFDKKSFAIKEYQIDKYKKQNLDIFLIDYETRPGNIYFAWFNINEIDNMIDPSKDYKTPYYNKEKGTIEYKCWKSVDLHGKEIHHINFKNSNNEKIIDNVFKLDKKNNNTRFIESGNLQKTISRNKHKM